MKQTLILFTLFLTACATGKKMTPGACDEYFKSVKIHTIKGTTHCRSIIIANDVVIRQEENDASLLKSISVITCEGSFETYGDIGANGIIVAHTEQTFDFVFPSQIDIKNASSYNNRKKIYFLNGFLITNDSLKISRNAIKRIEVLKPERYTYTEKNSNAVLINIWILTKKEVRKSMRN